MLRAEPALWVSTETKVLPVSASSPRPHPDVVFRELEGETLLIHLGSNDVFVLNETGARCWSMLRDGLGHSELCDRLCADFEVSRSEVEREVGQLVRELVEAGLLVEPSH